MKKVIVVGGGAAGMMAAISAADSGAEVTLYEKNEKLGKKIYITGKGRCNVTNDCEPDAFFENVVTNRKFLYSPYYGFDNTAVMKLIEESGCKLKTERGNRVFPVSDHSSDIIAALTKAMKSRGVRVCLNSEVAELLIKDNICYGIKLRDNKTANERVNNASDERVNNASDERVNKSSNGKANSEKTVEADKIILATGGLSYSTTGSTGDGIKWAINSGHTISECRPGLVPLNIKEEWVKDLQGLSLKNVGLVLQNGKKKIYEGFGEMLFTHFGVSGPLVLSASSYYTAFIQKHPECKYDIKLKLDLKNAISYEQLDKRILRDFEKYSNKQFKNSLDDLLPSKMIPVVVMLSGIGAEKPVNLITREEREKLVKLLKEMELTVASERGFAEAIITGGGVSVKDINPSTMESRLVKNLFFAGEMIDVDALTGGFNLQIAWSTGHLAGETFEY